MTTSTQNNNALVILRLSLHFILTILIMQIPILLHSNIFLLSIGLWNSQILYLQKNKFTKKDFQKARKLNIACILLFGIVILFVSQQNHLKSMLIMGPILTIATLYLDHRWNN